MITKYFKFILLVYIALFFNAFKVEQDKYKYIEIEECFIPVPTKAKLINKSSEFTYNFSMPEFSILMGISVFKSSNTSYNETIKKIHTMQTRILLKETERKGFKIIVSQTKDSLFTDKVYYLIGEKSTIYMNVLNPNEVDYLIDYCEQTRK